MIETDRRPEELLRRCEMPAEEIRWVVTADDPAVVHMLIELHGERLREELVDRLRTLRELEVSLTGSRIAESFGR